MLSYPYDKKASRAYFTGIATCTIALGLFIAGATFDLDDQSIGAKVLSGAGLSLTQAGGIAAILQGVFASKARQARRTEGALQIHAILAPLVKQLTGINRLLTAGAALTLLYAFNLADTTAKHVGLWTGDFYAAASFFLMIYNVCLIRSTSKEIQRTTSSETKQTMDRLRHESSQRFSGTLPLLTHVAVVNGDYQAISASRTASGTVAVAMGDLSSSTAGQGNAVIQQHLKKLQADINLSLIHATAAIFMQVGYLAYTCYRLSSPHPSLMLVDIFVLGVLNVWQSRESHTATSYLDSFSMSVYQSKQLERSKAAPRAPSTDGDIRGRVAAAINDGAAQSGTVAVDIPEAKRGPQGDEHQQGGPSLASSLGAFGGHNC